MIPLRIFTKNKGLCCYQLPVNCLLKNITLLSTVVNKSYSIINRQLVTKMSTTTTATSPIATSMEIESVEAKKFKTCDNKENCKNPDNTKLYFVKITQNASTPTKGSEFSAGYDLKSAYKTTVPARGSALVKTDIKIKVPTGHYGRVAPRSGLALKNKIDVGAGVIDEDYRGPVGVILFNHGDEDFEINEGDRIAQLICEKISYPEIVEVENLEDTERGAGGFGSTGVGNNVNGASN